MTRTRARRLARDLHGALSPARAFAAGLLVVLLPPRAGPALAPRSARARPHAWPAKPRVVRPLPHAWTPALRRDARERRRVWPRTPRVALAPCWRGSLG